MSRNIKAKKGLEIECKGWEQEAVLRMLYNNLDPEVAEHPEKLVVYGGIGKAARNWESFDAIVETLRRLESDETMLVQSGKPVAVFKTHEEAPASPPRPGPAGPEPPSSGAGLLPGLVLYRLGLAHQGAGLPGPGDRLRLWYRGNRGPGGGHL